MFLEHGNFPILLNMRGMRVINVRSPKLLAEIENIKNSLEESDHQVAEKINFEEAEKEEMLITCQCCFDETVFENLSNCAEGHLFCNPCLVEYVKVQIEVGVKKGQLGCMENDCDAFFPRSILITRLSQELMDKLDERIAAYNVNASGLTNLATCPKCHNRFELSEEEKVLNCQHCHFSSCRLCQEPWNKDHIGKRCDEIEGKKEILLRRAYEEKMTEALVRQCPKCRTKILKTEGCNKMTCSCGGTLCYVCRAPNINYSHFCQHMREPGQNCRKCKACSLYEDSSKRDFAKIEELEVEKKEKVETEHESRKRKLAEEIIDQPKQQKLEESCNLPVISDIPGTSHFNERKRRVSEFGTKTCDNSESNRPASSDVGLLLSKFFADKLL